MHPSDSPDPAAQAAFAAVRQVLGDTPAEFNTAGELAELMAALPAATPVSIAEVVRIDPDLDLDTTVNVTASAAEIITLVDGGSEIDGEPAVTDTDGRELASLVPGVELGAYIIAEDHRVPRGAIAFPAHESAIEALQNGDLERALSAECELLNWIAGTLETGNLDPDADTLPAWVADVGLREQLHIEGQRLRQSAARIEALRGKLATDSTTD